jgi:DNA mismatch repair ATPase MutS
MADPGIAEFTDLGHPLIAEPERVTNDIRFDPFRFVLLTGSNMSGKSTFLRSLGVAFVLAGCGAPVCATSARLHLMPVLVSMRIADSLSDHASYFYAEVVRLKKIMNALDQQQSLILLDEILRGTNSDDKRKGTMDFIRQLMQKQAVGMLATHDLEVCKLTDEYQPTLVNKCFEVEIIEDDLHFDYKLRDGICQNQSASFLMRKMGVI